MEYFDFFHFNDVYHLSNIETVSKFGSILARHVRRSSAENRGFTIFSGDCFSPSLESLISRGAYMVPVLNSLGVDMACPGNHDFDYGEERLSTLLTATRFPWTLCNYLKPGGSMTYSSIAESAYTLAGMHSYIFRERLGFRFGFFGTGGTDWPSLCQYLPACYVESPVIAARKMARYLRQIEKCDFVIAITHMRLTEDLKVSEATTAHDDCHIDLLLGGHDHEIVCRFAGDTCHDPSTIWQGAPNEDIVKNGRVTASTGRIRVIKSGSDFQSFSEIRIFAERQSNRKARVVRAINIVQATDYQASCVAWSTLKRRGAINWLICDFAYPQYHERVQRLCESLTANHAIFRTGFVVHRRELYQVVWKDFRPSINSHLHLKSIENATSILVEADRTRQAKISQPQTAFELLSQGEKIQRLLIRVSHAQYDGWSLSILNREIKLFLQGQVPQLGASFAAHLHLSRVIEVDQGVKYWRTLLSGSSMTEAVKRKGPIYLDPADSAIIRMLPTNLLKAPKPLSQATSIKAAWSLVLAEMTGKKDVVFGSSVWGRNAPVPFADSVIGSCLSHIPTRVRLDACQRYIELLEQLQLQHLESMRFESLGANTIVEKCTDWSRWTRFSSLLVFQALEIKSLDTGNPAAKEDFTIDEIVDPADRTDLLLHVEPLGEETRVVLRFSKTKIPGNVSKIMIESFVRHLELATQSASCLIKIQYSSPPQLPIVLGVDLHDVNWTQETSSPGISHVEAAVESAWAKVLDLSTQEICDCRMAQQSFLEIWGNLVSASALAQEYNQNGFIVSTEHLLQNQTMKEQIELLARLSG